MVGPLVFFELGFFFLADIFITQPLNIISARGGGWDLLSFLYTSGFKMLISWVMTLLQESLESTKVPTVQPCATDILLSAFYSSCVMQENMILN